MGKVLSYPGDQARASSLSTGYRSGRKSLLDTPVSRSIDNTNSAGTPRFDRVSQYQTCDCVVPMRSAKGFWPPARSQARLSASVDMESTYPFLGDFQPKTLSATKNLEFGSFLGMSKASKDGLAKRVKHRRERLNMSQTELAKAVGMKQQGILNIEKGIVERPRRLLEIAKALCTTQEWLLEATGPEEVAPTVSRQQVVATIESLDPRLLPALAEFLNNLQRKDQAA